MGATSLMLLVVNTATVFWAAWAVGDGVDSGIGFFYFLSAVSFPLFIVTMVLAVISVVRKKGYVLGAMTAVISLVSSETLGACLIRKSVAISMLVLAVSVTLLISGGFALWNAGIVADENNLATSFTPLLWLPFGAGLIGFMVSLPWFLGTVTTTPRPRTERERISSRPPGDK
ncbi:hypothetical protein CXX84_10510 [Arthrobacter sp. AFG7.2]|uniref:hypothetical protein n=1 Tax=Arthrobacter sp. AFG7.2 TaxID=1688693 RepID=UPI000C9E0202|nr:hypothetical protein [Arthrobacter sp. AFG7.2]PNI08358.1 hypothetical protein CXX84_10510 [Arthrobacter sp. AFG7.2]